jgi:hypothetical protein
MSGSGFNTGITVLKPGCQLVRVFDSLAICCIYRCFIKLFGISVLPGLCWKLPVVGVAGRAEHIPATGRYFLLQTRCGWNEGRHPYWRPVVVAGIAGWVRGAFRYRRCPGTGSCPHSAGMFVVQTGVLAVIPT